MKIAAVFTSFALITSATAARLRVDPSPTSQEEADNFVDPVDNLEGQIIGALEQVCTSQVTELLACYDGSEAELMGCTNCSWGKLLTVDGAPACTDDEEVQADYVACAASCRSDCDEAVASLYACGKPTICGEERPNVALEVA